MTNTRCQVGQQAASEAEAGAVKAAPAGTARAAIMKYVFTWASADGPKARFFEDAGALVAYAVGWAEKGAEFVGFCEGGVWGFRA